MCAYCIHTGVFNESVCVSERRLWQRERGFLCNPERYKVRWCDPTLLRLVPAWQQHCGWPQEENTASHRTKWQGGCQTDTQKQGPGANLYFLLVWISSHMFRSGFMTLVLSWFSFGMLINDYLHFQGRTNFAYLPAKLTIQFVNKCQWQAH